jgi:tetratricopeptide (TPR) repeat protein
MEYIKGVPILEYCDTEKLSTRSRLELFTSVCQAIQHAHQKGIIHRDIKPSNVLVTMHDGVPVPKVIDFGIAKATNSELTQKTLFTEHRQMIGTPAYMSPEQAEMSGLDIDTRSDIYSLGVLLYELLTGTTPFAADELVRAGFAEMMRIIREVEPHKPSTRLSSLGDTATRTAQQRHLADPSKLSTILRGDLDWIVMRCLEKDRTRRYETANGLAMDIRRHLNDEPVVAGPPGAAYRLRKFVKRNRGQVIAAGIVAAALVLGVVGTSAGLVWALYEKDRADAEKDKAVLAAESEAKAKLDADRRRQEAETNLAYATKGNEVLGSVFANLDPKRTYATVAELRNALRNNLARGTQDLEGSSIGDPLAVAEIQTTLGTSLFGLGAADEAIPLLTKALETRRERLGPEHPDTLTAMHQLAMTHWEAGNLDMAMPLSEETVRLRRATLGPDDAATLTSMNNLACVYWKAGELDRSIPLLEELVQRQEAKFGRGGIGTLAAMANLGENYKDAGRAEEAIALLEESLGFMKASLGPVHPDTLICMTNLAQSYQAAGRYDLAVPLYEETIERANATLGPDHPHTIKTVNSVAHAYWSTGRFDKAVPLFEEKLKRLEASLGRDHPDTLAAAADLGGNYLGVGRVDKALPLLEETFAIATPELGPEHPTTLLAMNNLAAAYLQAGRLDACISMYEELLGRYDATRAKDDANRLVTAVSLGTAYRNAGRLDSAIPLLEETLTLEKAAFGPDDPSTARCMFHLAVAYQSAGRLDEAVPLLEASLECLRATLGPDRPDTLGTMHSLAVAYWQRGQLDKSVPLFEELLTRREATLGRSHPATLSTVADLGVNYLGAGRVEEAIALLEEAHRAATRHPWLRAYAPNLLEAYARTADPDSPSDRARIVDLVQELLADARDAMPDGSPQLAGQLASFGRLLLEVKAWDEAEPLIRESLATREAEAPDDWLTFNARAMLGGVLLGKGKLAEAEPLLLEGYRGMKAREAAIPPQGTMRIPEALERLVQLYEATGNETEAATWRAELEAARAVRAKAGS